MLTVLFLFLTGWRCQQKFRKAIITAWTRVRQRTWKGRRIRKKIQRRWTGKRNFTKRANKCTKRHWKPWRWDRQRKQGQRQLEGAIPQPWEGAWRYVGCLIMCIHHHIPQTLPFWSKNFLPTYYSELCLISFGNIVPPCGSSGTYLWCVAKF